MKKQHYIYYGILQSFHILFLIILLSKPLWIFGFVNNHNQWNLQLLQIFNAISIIDFFNALVSIFIVFSYLKNNKKIQKLETMVLSISVYSALIFGLGINFNNLQKGNEIVMILFSIPFLPVFYFFYLNLKKEKISD